MMRWARQSYALFPYTTLFRSQDRDQADPVGQLLAFHRLERRLDVDRTHPRVGERLVPQQPRQLAHDLAELLGLGLLVAQEDRKSTRLNSSHMSISYAVFCLKK